MMNIVRYIRGWMAFVRTFRLMRAKRHGAGRARLIHCIRGGACSRSIVDGQFRRPPVFPRFMTKYSPKSSGKE